jgi:uncharacterized repeat protein (TIGR03803 family)
MPAAPTLLRASLIAALALALPVGAAHAAKLKTLYSFTGGTDGAVPRASLTLDADGALYGTTASGGIGNCNFAGGNPGCGTVFKLTPPAIKGGTWTESVLYSFEGGADGAWPYAGLILDAQGALYGTTVYGGRSNCNYGCGTVFKLTPGTGGVYTKSVLYSFTGGADGAAPVGPLILDSRGALYGTADNGGSSNCNHGCGVVFKLTPGAEGVYTESVLYSFTGGTDGAYPKGGVIRSFYGALFGTTWEGGGSDCGGVGCGTVFKLMPGPGGSYTESVLHSFTDVPDGANPVSGVIMDFNGALYGTTGLGGSSVCAFGCGTVFKLRRGAGGSYTESVLHSFTGGSDGSDPSSLFRSDDSVLYGVTSLGGASNDGTVFKLTRSKTERVLHSFSGSDGEGPYPFAGLISRAPAVLYGTTAGGGAYGYGTVFELRGH